MGQDCWAFSQTVIMNLFKFWKLNKEQDVLPASEIINSSQQTV